MFSNYFDVLILKINFKNKNKYYFKIFWSVTITVIQNEIILCFQKKKWMGKKKGRWEICIFVLLDEGGKWKDKKGEEKKF